MINLEWKDEHGGTSGVHDLEGDLLWWNRPGGPNGRFGEAARSQTFADFRENGPAVSAPEEVLEKLYKIIGKQV